MIRLIKCELKKIFKKKSFLIVTFIFILYAVLTNVIYHDIEDYYIAEVDINELETINKELNLDNVEELYQYIENLSLIEIEKLKTNYDSANQKHLLDNYLYDVVYDLKENEFITKDIELGQELQTKYDIYYTKIKNNDYKFFINNRIDELKEKLNKADSEKDKNVYETLIKLNEYKLKNDIGYDVNNYLYRSVDAIAIDLGEYNNLKYKTGLTREETERLDYLEEEMLVNKYILENKIDVESRSTLNAVLKNFANEFGLFILIFIVMISGSIVSEEFNKGTIKFLLTKPFKRRTILTSKLLTILFLLPVIILFMSIMEILLGGLILGFKSLSIPVLIYKSGSLIEMNIFKYLILTLISNLPMYLVLAVFGFMLSTITVSTSAAITVTFLFYLISNVVASLALVFNFKFFKAFISLHWDFSYLVSYTSNPYNIKPVVSFMVVGIYLVIMLGLTYLCFNKKDVKNV